VAPPSKLQRIKNIAGYSTW